MYFANNLAGISLTEKFNSTFRNQSAIGVYITIIPDSARYYIFFSLGNQLPLFCKPAR